MEKSLDWLGRYAWSASHLVDRSSLDRSSGWKGVTDPLPWCDDVASMQALCHTAPPPSLVADLLLDVQHAAEASAGTAVGAGPPLMVCSHLFDLCNTQQAAASQHKQHTVRPIVESAAALLAKGQQPAGHHAPHGEPC